MDTQDDDVWQRLCDLAENELDPNGHLRIYRETIWPGTAEAPGKDPRRPSEMGVGSCSSQLKLG